MKKRVLSVVLMLCFALTLFPVAASADILSEDLPSVSADNYVIIDGDTDQVVFGEKYDKEFDPGAMVQIMTAIIIIENGNLNDSVTVPSIPDNASNGNRLYLREGEKVNLSDLLEGIILYNANDAAVAAAVHIAGSEDAFVEEMNKRASKMGLEGTVFKSVYGSADDQTTTAKDLAVLANYASNLPKYVEFAIQPNMSWDSEMNQDTIINVNGMQNVDDTAVGIKVESGDKTNLTASISKGDRTIVGVIIGADDEDNAYYQMQEAITFGYENTVIQKLVNKGTAVTSLNFRGNRSVRVAASKNYATTVSASDSSSLTSIVNIDKTEPPFSEGDEVGTIKIYRDEEVIDEVPLVALDSARAGIDWKFTLVSLIAIVLFILLAYILFQLQFGNHPTAPGNRRGPAPKRNSGATNRRTTTQPQLRRPSANKPPRSTQQPQPSQPRNTAGKPAATKNRSTRPGPASAGSAAGREALEKRLKEQKENRGGRY